MSRAPCLHYDTLDDRREIHTLLARLPPVRRIAWLRWACRSAALPNSDVQPKVAAKTLALAERARWDSSADDRLTLEAYMDVWYLSFAYAFDLDRALAKLVEMVRQPSQSAGPPLAPPASAATASCPSTPSRATPRTLCIGR